MIHYPNGFDPEETNGVYANNNGYDIIRPCSEPDTLEKLTAAARSKEIIVNVPKLKIEKKEPWEWEWLAECVPGVYKTPRIEFITEEWLKKEFLPKLKNEKVENEMMDITKASMDELAAEIARRKENEQLHLDHPFYKRAQHYREIERYEQIIKGSHKYKEPFNPMSWTPRQLLQHAMQENVDQGHYIVGLYEWIEEMENQIANLKQENETYKARGDAYSEQLKDIGRLTRYMVEEFPEAGRAGQLSVDVAIELLKDYKKAHNTYNETRKHNIKMLEEHNSLGKYLTVHYPQMLVEGETAISITKRVMDAYRKGEEFAKKQF